MKKYFVVSAATALVVSILTFGIMRNWDKKHQPEPRLQIEQMDRYSSEVNFPVDGQKTEREQKLAKATDLDFTQVADHVKHAVVHIKSTVEASASQPNNPFGDDMFSPFFRQFPQERGPSVGTGSGVIVSPEGYIVTNNHVIENASEIEVSLLDNRVLKAKLIGTDPTTDIALLKIDANDLEYLAFENSDQVKVGEWVLAVGNPFDLTSTVTAGIISATGRNINLLTENYAIESFIQTDAAINPGNSGGALVDLNGALVGINTAIASPTGSYSGYGFAVPSNIVQKVIKDLEEYGEVKRGFLGIQIRSVDGNFAQAEGLKVNAGVYVDSLMHKSAAGTAGVKVGDVIVGLDGRDVKSTSDLQEGIGRKRPGDTVHLTINRNGSIKQIDVELRGLNKPKDVAANTNNGADDLFNKLGIAVSELDKNESVEMGLDGGVRIERIRNGLIREETSIRPGFIVTKVDKKPVKTIEQFTKAVRRSEHGVLLEGRYPNSEKTYYYGFGESSL